MTKTNQLTILSSRLSALRVEFRAYIGGISWTPITHDFGIYKMNITKQEAFLSHAEHHFVELEKMFEALKASEYREEIEK